MSHQLGTTLHAAPSKSYAFSTNYHACFTMPTWCRCAPPILLWPWPPYSLLPRSCFTWIFFVDLYWWVPLCVQRPAFSTNYHDCIAMPTWHRYAPHSLFWPWPPYNLFLRSCLTSTFYQFSLMGTTLCAAPFKRYRYVISTDHVCIAMPTSCRCAPPILFVLWPSYNLFPQGHI